MLINTIYRISPKLSSWWITLSSSQQKAIMSHLWNIPLHLLLDFLHALFQSSPFLDFSLFSSNRTIITVRGSQPVRPLLWGQVGSGRCQTQSLLRADQRRSRGWRRHLYVILSVFPFLLCHAAFHYTAMEWPSQRATLYWQSDQPMSKRKGGGGRRWKAGTKKEKELICDKIICASRSNNMENKSCLVEIQVSLLFFWKSSWFFKTWYKTIQIQYEFCFKVSLKRVLQKTYKQV